MNFKTFIFIIINFFFLTIISTEKKKKLKRNKLFNLIKIHHATFIFDNNPNLLLDQWLYSKT